ncbi:MAG TPA: winged helix-turn-helix domain-containing protein [Gammaproteobacteria bacterium]
MKYGETGMGEARIGDLSTGVRSGANPIYAFGEFRLDPAGRRLTCTDGEVVAITGKPFDALVYLVERAGTVVSRRELAHALWPTTIVEDNNLSQVVLALRRVLGDAQDAPRFVATVPRRGYQFVAAVRRLQAAPDGPSLVPAPRPMRRHGLFAAGVLAVAAIAGAWLASRDDAGAAGEGLPPNVSSRAPEPTTSLEAYALYSQAVALYRASGGIGVGMPLAVRETLTARLDEALAIDPDFAAALGWRAHVALDSLMFDPLPADDWPLASRRLIERSERDASRALELDPGLAIAHVALARLDMYRGRFAESKVRLDEARRLRPTDSVVLHYLALVANLLGEHREAASAARRALELEPKNPAPYAPLSVALRALGDQAGAAAAARGMIEAAPAAAIGYVTLARTETERGDVPRILEALRLAERFLDETTRNFRADAALSYARAGAPEDAARLIREIEEDSAGRHIGPGLAAMMRLAVGDYAGARELLDEAIAARADGMDPMPLFLIARNSWADPVLEQPEWRALRERLE